MDQANQDIHRFKQALQNAVDSPATLFDILPESVVWSSAKLVLDHDDGSEQPDILFFSYNTLRYLPVSGPILELIAATALPRPVPMITADR